MYSKDSYLRKFQIKKDMHFEVCLFFFFVLSRQKYLSKFLQELYYFS